MAFKKIKDIFDSEEIMSSEEDFNKNSKNKDKKDSNGNQMILLEPRAYSESQQIADQLKLSNSVIVNFKRVTSDQAKRIIDFLSGTLYAIGGDLQKLGNGIYLCTPKIIDVKGNISDDEGKKEKEEDLIEW